MCAPVAGDIDMKMRDGAFVSYIHLPILKSPELHLRPGAIIIGEKAFEQVPHHDSMEESCR